MLTILYMEVCARIGLPLRAAVLEEGRYTVLWPKCQPLSLAGQEVVIDVYSQGSLFLLSEVSPFKLTWTLIDLAFHGTVLQNLI